MGMVMCVKNVKTESMRVNISILVHVLLSSKHKIYRTVLFLGQHCL